MHAIIEDSGTQIRVSPGDVIDIDPRGPAEAGELRTITFDRVLLVSPDGGGEGKSAHIGTPYVEGATVTAEVVESDLGPKLDIFKFRRRKGYRRKQGHRQEFLRVRIGDITLPGGRASGRR